MKPYRLLSMFCLGTFLLAGEVSRADQSVRRPTQIKLKPTISSPCISVETPEVHIILPKAKIDGYAAVPRKVEWKTEAERWALIRGDQARDIEGKISNRENDGGCFSVALADLEKTHTRDGEYLIWKFLEDGAAAVIANGRATPETSIIMKSMPNEEGSGADMWFLLNDGSKPFLKLSWWMI